VSQQAILGPVLAMMALTFVVWVYMYIRRISFITRTRLSPGELAIPGTLARVSPALVANPADNFRNLFEIPVLFYALTPWLAISNRVDATYLHAAWVFVAFRVLHSAVHCSVNIVMLRFYLYLVSTLAVWFMVGRAALQLLSR
jgi:hypothetical protein